jgi:NitT/TauT family transport system permease protein
MSAPRATSLVAGAKGLVGAAVLVGLWQLVVVSGVLKGGLAVPAWSIAAAAVDGLAGGELWSALLATAQAWAIGLLCCVLLGVVIGGVVGLSRWADAATRVLIDFLRPVPSVALVPVVVVFFGITIRAQVVLVIFASVWPILFNTRYGVQNVDPRWLEEGRLMGLGRFGLVGRVVLPGALPAVITGIRTAASIAIIVAVAAELVVGSPGLGYFVNLMQQANRPDDAYAGIVVAGLFGYLAHLALVWLERRVTGWHLTSTEGRRR